jgi:ribose transport system substrate-binding protein
MQKERAMTPITRWFATFCLLPLLGACDGGGGAAPGGSPDQAAGRKLRVAFVSNNAADFWQIAKAGVLKAEADFDIRCDFRMPDDGSPAKQHQIVQDLLAAGIDGMAISPIDPVNMRTLLNEVAAKVPLICHDSDAPESNRRCYIGTNNFEAGRHAGKLVREVLPNGGSVMVFVGRMDVPNAVERVAGLRKALEGSEITVLDVRTDLVDRARAKQNVEDTLTRTPDIGCLVGIWAYNAPAILSAVKDAGRAGQIPIVAFDEEEDTLQGIKDGHIQATVVQQPYEFGYQSVKILSQLARGEDPGIPDDKIIHVPVKIVRADNVDAFWANLRKQRGK